MPRRFSRRLRIANQIGDRRVDKVMGAIFEREKKAYLDAEKIYNEMIEEVESRVEYRYGLILELMMVESDVVVDECLAVLSHVAALRAGEKGRMVKKLRKLN